MEPSGDELRVDLREVGFEDGRSSFTPRSTTTSFDLPRGLPWVKKTMVAASPRSLPSFAVSVPATGLRSSNSLRTGEFGAATTGLPICSNCKTLNGRSACDITGDVAGSNVAAGRADGSGMIVLGTAGNWSSACAAVSFRADA